MWIINIKILGDHPNIIKFHEVYDDEFYLYIVQEFFSEGELLDRILKL